MIIMITVKIIIIITFVLCFDRFALTSSSQAAGSSDCGNLLVQAWNWDDHDDDHYDDDNDDDHDDDDDDDEDHDNDDNDDSGEGDPERRLSQLRGSSQNGLCW